MHTHTYTNNIQSLFDPKKVKNFYKYSRWWFMVFGWTMAQCLQSTIHTIQWTNAHARASKRDAVRWRGRRETQQKWYNGIVECSMWMWTLDIHSLSLCLTILAMVLLIFFKSKIHFFCGSRFYWMRTYTLICASVRVRSFIQPHCVEFECGKWNLRKRKIHFVHILFGNHHPNYDCVLSNRHQFLNFNFHIFMRPLKTAFEIRPTAGIEWWP